MGIEPLSNQSALERQTSSPEYAPVIDIATRQPIEEIVAGTEVQLYDQDNENFVGTFPHPDELTSLSTVLPTEQESSLFQKARLHVGSARFAVKEVLGLNPVIIDSPRNRTNIEGLKALAENKDRLRR